MFKKITLLAAALTAFMAFAVPAVAQAEEVTNAGGEEAEEITASSSNTEWTSGAGVIKCSTFRLILQRIGKGHYTTPFTNIFIAQGHGGNHNNPECVIVPAGVTFTITSIHATMKFDNGGNARAIFKYTYEITHPVSGPIPCETKEGTESEESSYTPTTDEASFVGLLQGMGLSLICPNTGEFHADFTITDENGEPVSIH